MAVEVHNNPETALVELEYVLQITRHAPHEETILGRVHYSTRPDAERQRDKMFEDGFVGEVDVLCRRVSRWQQVPV